MKKAIEGTSLIERKRERERERGEGGREWLDAGTVRESVQQIRRKELKSDREKRKRRMRKRNALHVVM